jgi:hypothetical protein
MLCYTFPYLFHCTLTNVRILEVLLLLEEHSKADDGSIDEKPANDAHYHSWDSYNISVRENDW